MNRPEPMSHFARDWARSFGGAWLPPRSSALRTFADLSRGGVPGILTGRRSTEDREFVGSAFGRTRRVRAWRDFQASHWNALVPEPRSAGAAREGLRCEDRTNWNWNSPSQKDSESLVVESHETSDVRGSTISPLGNPTERSAPGFRRRAARDEGRNVRARRPRNNARKVVAGVAPSGHGDGDGHGRGCGRGRDAIARVRRR